jgi:hypothetical protein
VVQSTGYGKAPECKIRDEHKTSLAAPHLKTAGLQIAKANDSGAEVIKQHFIPSPKSTSQLGTN